MNLDYKNKYKKYKKKYLQKGGTCDLKELFNAIYYNSDTLKK